MAAAPKLYDLARMSVANTGTGAITLGSAVPGCLTFALAGVSDGDTIAYSLWDPVNNGAETGFGVYTAGTLQVTRNVRRSTNSNNPINMSSSTQVSITAAAEDLIAAYFMGQGMGPMINGAVFPSTASNALTLSALTAGLNAPSIVNPVRFILRNGTASSGNYLPREVQSALAITVPSGATLGHVSARDQQIFLYAIDNAGTVELAVSNRFFDASVRTVSTTAISAAATDPTVMYSTAARSNVAWVAIARCVSNQAIAGTWAALPTQIDLAPFVVPTNGFSCSSNGTPVSLTNSAFTKITQWTVDFDPDGTFDNVTNFRHQPKVAGKYYYGWNGGSVVTAANTFAIGSLFRNGSRFRDGTLENTGGSAGGGGGGSAVVDMNGTSDFVDLQVFQNSGAVQNSNPNPFATFLTGQRVGS